MKRLAKWLLYAVVGAAFVYGGAVLSDRRSRVAAPNVSADPSTQVPPDRASGPPPGYEPPAPEDTPCLQPEFATRCIGRARARRGLMELAGLQEERMRVRGSYAEDAAALGFRPESGMVLRMRGGQAGWTAEYHHTAGVVGCAVYNGEVDAPFTTIGGVLSAAPGAVACDDPLATGG
ncbi:MAG TPA: hypothetical protein VMM35_08325 [Longimicrobiales bacterium]|nr:hypothetical protein [Longimicrobiales bacterium]